MKWKQIKDETDIRGLMTDFNGFEGSCISKISYCSGAYADSNSLHAVNDKLHLKAVFERKYNSTSIQVLEIMFCGLITMKLSPVPKGYESVIDCASMKISPRGVMWSNWDDFIESHCVFGATCIMADKAFFRFELTNNL